MLAKRDKDYIVITPDEFIKLIEDASKGDLTYSAIGNYEVTDSLLIDYRNIIGIMGKSYIIFTNCVFDELVLKGAVINYCHFIDISVKKLKLVNCLIQYCVFTECFIDKIEIDSSSIFSNTISKCNIVGGYIERCNITENMMTNFDLKGDSDIIFNHTYIIDNHIIDCHGNFAFMNCSIKKNKLSELLMRDLYFYKCEALNNTTSMCCLDGMKSYESTVILNEVCPKEGSFIGYKKVWYLADLNHLSWMPLKLLSSKITEYIAVLEIPEDAKRSSGGSDKCRADKVKVQRLEDMDGNEVKDAVGYSIIGVQSFVNSKNIYATVLPQNIQMCIYKAGEIIYADSFDENKFNTCSNGIHFFISKDCAREFNI